MATKRPAPRTSSLMEEHPVTPAPAAAPAPVPAPAEPAVKRPKTKLQADADEDLAGRVKAAWHYTPIDQKEASFKDFLLGAIVAEVERREKANNGGREYEPLRQKLTPGARVR